MCDFNSDECYVWVVCVYICYLLHLNIQCYGTCMCLCVYVYYCVCEWWLYAHLVCMCMLCYWFGDCWLVYVCCWCSNNGALCFEYVEWQLCTDLDSGDACAKRYWGWCIAEEAIHLLCMLAMIVLEKQCTSTGMLDCDMRYIKYISCDISCFDLYLQCEQLTKLVQNVGDLTLIWRQIICQINDLTKWCLSDDCQMLIWQSIWRQIQ